MSHVGTREKGTTRRGFVKNITAGAGGIALASSLLLPEFPGNDREWSQQRSHKNFSRNASIFRRRFIPAEISALTTLRQYSTDDDILRLIETA